MKKKKPIQKSGGKSKAKAPAGKMRAGMGPRDGSGPNPNCPLKKKGGK